MPDVPPEIYKILRDNFPLVCADGVLVHDRKVLLIKRSIEPFKGFWTIPGGHVDYGESLEETVLREVLEETSIKAHVIGFVDIFSNPQRDPWGHIISIVYLLTADYKNLDASDGREVSGAIWRSVNNLPSPIGFDHEEMIRAAYRKYSSMF